MNVYNNTGDAGANPALEAALTKAPSARDAPEKVSFLVRARRCLRPEPFVPRLNHVSAWVAT